MKNDWSSLNYGQKSQRLMDNQKREQGCSTHPICLGCINKFIDDLLTKQRREIAERLRNDITYYNDGSLCSGTELQKLITDLERES